MCHFFPNKLATVLQLSQKNEDGGEQVGNAYLAYLYGGYAPVPTATMFTLALIMTQ